MTNSKKKSATIISTIPAITNTIIPIVITARFKSTIFCNDIYYMSIDNRN